MSARVCSGLNESGFAICMLWSGSCIDTHPIRMAVALWDMVAKAANLAQLLGLDAVTLITIAMSSFLRFHQASKECRKLEVRVMMLRRELLMSSVVGGHWITQQQQQQNDVHVQLAGGGQLQLQAVASVLIREASDVVESYKRSSLYARVRGARGMATRFRDLRSRVDSCCHLILAVNAFLLVVVQPPNQNQNHHAPPSSHVIRSTEGNDVGVPPSAAGDSAHAAAEPSSSSTTPPGDTHVIDITPIQPDRND